MARAAPIEDENWPRTVAAFEEWHALQPERWEFVAGRPRLMAPASMRHSVIKNNMVSRCAGARWQRLHGAGRWAADPDRRHLGDPRRSGDLRAARPDHAGDRRAGDHRRGDVALDRRRRPWPQMAELPQDREPPPLPRSSPSTSAWSTSTAAPATSGASASSAPAASPSTTRRSRSSSTRSMPRPTSPLRRSDRGQELGASSRGSADGSRRSSARR